MLRIKDRIAGDPVTFHLVQSTKDCHRVADFVRAHRKLGIDTESTGINCYRPQWKLRTVQVGHATASYVVPQHFRKLIAWIMRQDVRWIAHNGPHDIRSIDRYLGYESQAWCDYETFIPSHHRDSRNQAEGGTGHGLKELATALVDRDAGKWERELKAAFKEILIPIPGEVYKSGPRKGTPKYRKARLSEGWGLIDSNDPRYVAYAAADPILAFRVWSVLRQTVREQRDLYLFDQRVARACDVLQRRGMPLDIPYTQRLSRAYLRKARELEALAAEYGIHNVHSGQQVADCLLRYGARLTERTPTGQYVTDGNVLRGLLKQAEAEAAADANESCLYRVDIIRAVLGAKQLMKRRESYTEQMLAEVDEAGRVHPSINTLAARTARMSVSAPPLHQLPTKDNEGEL